MIFKLEIVFSEIILISYSKNEKPTLIRRLSLQPTRIRIRSLFSALNSQFFVLSLLFATSKAKSYNFFVYRLTGLINLLKTSLCFAPFSKKYFSSNTYENTSRMINWSEYSINHCGGSFTTILTKSNKNLFNYYIFLSLG